MSFRLLSKISITPRIVTSYPLFASQVRSISIQTEDTPNEHALKFLPSTTIIPNGKTIEFLNRNEAMSSPLARKLFAVDGIKSVMFGSNFITVEKKLSTNWILIKPEVFSILTESLTSGEPILDKASTARLNQNDQEYIEEEEDDIIANIKELIVTRIRPAIQEDGGDIEYVSFDDDGTVVLRLRGACRSCDSSSVTLKNGIESMLKYYIEEVTNVRQIEEEEEEEDPVAKYKTKEFRSSTSKSA